jgi:hypothetical protein
MVKRLEVLAKEDDGFLRIVLHGDFASDLPDAVDDLARIIALRRSTPHTRFLVDARAVEARMSIPTTFEFATLAYSEEPETGRVAGLDRPEHLVQGRFFENLLQSRGRIYRLFTNEAEAVEWLLSENT